jgi:Fe-S-cluster containining protein
MTPQELSVLTSLPMAASVQLQTETSADGRFVTMQAKPCPFYDAIRRSCAVYEHRPYNCRRFQCGRWDTRTQPYQNDPMPAIKADNDLRWSYGRNQQQHSAWALAHGWELP